MVAAKTGWTGFVMGALLALAGCGGVNRNFVLEERADAADMIEAIDRAATERGLAPRTREGRSVRLAIGQRGTRVTLSVRRQRIVLSVRVNEELTPATIEEELAAGEAFGRQLMADANAVGDTIQGERAAEDARRAEEERLRQIREEQERAANAEQAARLQAFMQANQDRNRAFAERNRTPEPASPSSAAGPSAATTSGGASGHCCINGAYYSCPSAAAVDRCSGAFARCAAGCGGFSCIEGCMSSDPPDPSSCSRDPGRDGEC
ncbi:MAG: hypothetical protein AB8I08_37350 [Sandaracinaceae bacterium]